MLDAEDAESGQGLVRIYLENDDFESAKDVLNIAKAGSEKNWAFKDLAFIYLVNIPRYFY